MKEEGVITTVVKKERISIVVVVAAESDARRKGLLQSRHQPGEGRTQEERVVRCGEVTRMTRLNWLRPGQD
jgi:hypothetical protein